MSEVYFITHENMETNFITIDTYNDVKFAIGGVSDLMTDENVQIKSIVKVEDAKSIFAMEPKIVENKLTLEIEFEGNVVQDSEGLYVITYEEELDFEVMFSSKKEDILNFFAQNQGSDIATYETYKVNLENCTLTKTKIEIENYKYVLKEGDN